MNWTGGRLSRHSNAKRSLKDRHRQHFAKVHANLRSSSTKPSPLKFSFLGSNTESAVSIRHPSSVCNISSHEIIQSITPHRDRPIALQYLPHHSSQPPYLSHKSQYKDKTDRGVIQERVQENDLYGATPLPLERKRTWDLFTERAVNDSTQAQENESDFRRRKRILRQGDWVGVRVQRPLQLAFSSPDHAELVGKRRKVTDGHQARYSNKMQPVIRNPFATPKQTRQDMAYLGKSDVRISIGGKAVHPNIGLSSVPRGRREASARSCLFDPSQGSSSDVMLLDDEDHTGKKMQAGTGGYHAGRENPITDTHRSGYYRGRHNQYRGDSATSKTYNRYDCQSTVASVSQNGSETCKFPEFLGDPNIKGQPIISSSTTSLQHPRPRSTRTSVLLRSDSAEITASIVAQVGNKQPIVPSSQAVENDIWESWAAPVFDEHPKQRLHGLHSQKSRIRPVQRRAAVNHAPVSDHRNRPTESSDGHSSSRSGYGQSSIHTDSSLCSNQFSPIGSEVCYGAKLSPSKVGTKKISPLEPPIDNIHGGLRAKPIRQIDQLVKAQGGPDLDKLWKNFVFGASYGEVEAVSDQRRQNPKASCTHEQGRSPASSMLAVMSSWDSKPRL